jgi:hypothetical protein
MADPIAVVTVADIRGFRDLPLKSSDTVIETHIDLAEIDMVDNLGDNYLTTETASLKLLKILYTYISLLPGEPLVRIEGINKFKEQSAQYGHLTINEVTKIIEIYKARAVGLVSKLKIAQTPIEEEDETEGDRELFVANDFSMFTNAGDRTDLDLSEDYNE